MKNNNIFTRLFPPSRRYTAWRFDELEKKIDVPASPSESEYCSSFPVYSSGIEESFAREQKLIISLTSFPARIPTIYPCLYSLFHQTLKPDKIILWLSKDQFPNEAASLSKDLLYLQRFGLSICFVEDDLKPHKKYFYAFKQYPKDLIITADDDVLYAPSWLQTLYDAYLAHPGCVCGTRGRNIHCKPDHSGLASYDDWDLCDFHEECGPSHQILLTGAGGILYPPAFSADTLLDADMIKKYTYLADDLWLKTMELKNDIKCVKVRWDSDVVSVPDSQNVNLFTHNMYSGGNDEIIQKLTEEFPEWHEIKEKWS